MKDMPPQRQATTPPWPLAQELPQESYLPNPIFIYTQHYTFKLKTTLEVIFVLDWEEFILQYQFKELDDRMSKLEKVQNITNITEEIAMEIDR